MTDIVDNYAYKLKPFDHQRKALKLSYNKDRFAYFMEMGCVDGETEYLTKHGWKKIKDFNVTKPDEIFICDKNLTSKGNIKSVCNARFEYPEAFICKDTNRFYDIGGMYLTGDHTFIGSIYNTETDDRHRVFRSTAVSEVVEKALANDKLGFEVPFYTGESPASKCDLITYSKKYLEALALICSISHLNSPNKNRRNITGVVACKRKALFDFPGVTKIKNAFKTIGATFIQSKLENYNDVDMFSFALPFSSYLDMIIDIDTKSFKLFIDYLNKYRYFGIALTPGLYADPYHKETLGVRRTTFKLTPSFRPSPNKDFYEFLADMLFFHGVAKYTVISKKAPKLGRDMYFLSCHKPLSSTIPLLNFICRLNEVIDYDKPVDSYCFRTSTGLFMARRNGRVFITGNSGKTKTILDNAGILFKQGSIDSLFITAPNGVYSNWVNKEIPTHMPDDIKLNICHWISSKGNKYKRELAESIKKNDKDVLDVFVVNIEALNSKTCKEYINTFMKHHKAVMGVVDESTCIKNHTAKRTKEVIAIGDKCKVRRIATGSPVTNSPLDLFSQMRFLGKDTLPFGSYYSFRNTFAEIRNQEIGGGRVIPLITGYKNLDKLTTLISPVSFRVTKKECMDLPDKIYQTRYIDMTDEQLEIYTKFAKNAIAIFNEKEMTSRTALTTLMRLHQITCGCFTDDEGVTQSIPNKRLDELMTVLDEAQGKTIIFANYVRNIEDIVASIKKEYGSKSVVDYYGGTSYEDREKAKILFEDENSDVRFFVGNTQTAGRGITLVKATTTLYYSNDYNLEYRQQSEDRAHRFGQRNNVTYVDLIAKGTVDEKIVKALLNKRDIAGTILQDNLEDWIKLER